METSRRILLKTGLVTGGAALAAGVPALLDQRPSAAAPPPRTDPFTLGVASGDPLPDGFVIWTRLAPDPLADDGAGGMPSRRQQVGWQVATDERFSDVVRAGSVGTGPSSGTRSTSRSRAWRPAASTSTASAPGRTSHRRAGR